MEVSPLGPLMFVVVLALIFLGFPVAFCLGGAVIKAAVRFFRFWFRSSCLGCDHARDAFIETCQACMSGMRLD